jgi:heterodisulfide reductase subunit A-like polyferredoxin
VVVRNEQLYHKEVMIMSQSKCAKCDHLTFEMVENTPKGSKFHVIFIQCARCGAVVGVQPSENIPALLHFMKDMLAELAPKPDLSTRDAE